MLKRIDPLIAFAATIGGLVVFAYSTFATIRFVDDKHQSILGVLTDIQKTVRMIDQRTWELQKGMKR